MNIFEQKVFDFLRAHEIAGCLGVAVSGGADSVSLLVSLRNILGAENVKVINVNHNLREASETNGDSDFVKSLCRELDVYCEVHSFEPGEISDMAESRARGVEEAARYARYKVFDEFKTRHNLNNICLAHNQNDNLETAFMRFIQGSGLEGNCGISFERDGFIRPLINISRSEIENYLTEKNISWRTDSTNSDINYYRNKIRHILIPVLEENFPGWKRSVLSGIEKNSYDEKFIQNIVYKHEWNSDSPLRHRVWMNRQEFFSLDFSLQRRLIYKAFKMIKFGDRFPYKVLRNIVFWNDSRNREISSSKIQISCDSDKIYVERMADSRISNMTYEFMKIIFEDEKLFLINENKYSCENGVLFFIGEEKIPLVKISSPFLVRSFQSGDEIRDKNNRLKSVADIFSDWHIKKEDKNSILIIQSLSGNQEIIGIIGKIFGYKNWVLSENSAENLRASL